jgi:hypothetical protein
MLIKRLFVLLLIFAFLPAAAQQVYRWVDEEGNVQFTDTPPPDERETERVQIRRGPAEAIEAESDNDDGNANDGGVRLGEAECDGMRERLAEYQDADVLYRIGDDGTQEELEPEVAQAEIDRLQNQIERHCD